MAKHLAVFILFCLNNLFVLAQPYPAQNQIIGHTQVMFLAEPNNATNQYEFLVYENKNLIEKHKSGHPYFLMQQLLSYNKSYWYKVNYYSNNLVTHAKTYQFKTVKNKRANANNYNLTISNYDSLKTLNGLILMDNNFVVNRQGKVAFCIDSSITYVRDLTLTNQGTFLYLDSVFFAERDRNNKIVWQSKFIKTKDFEIKEYHHDIHKTKKGTYICLASVKYKNITQEVKYNALVELDKNNNILWMWHEKDYYPNDSNLFTSSHINSLFYDEEKDEIYCSNRDLHSIIKINKSTNKVTYSFGYNMGHDIPFYQNLITKMQHRVIKLPNQQFLIFNNDSGIPGNTKTSIIEITDPHLNDGRSDITWQYTFNFDNEIENHIPKMGGAIKLSNGNYLVACGVFDRNFEITPDGEIVWELRMEQYNKLVNQMAAVACYRNNYSSSLYPYSFIVYPKNNQKVLVNCGTEIDSYTLTLSNGKILKVTLEPNKSINLNSNTVLIKSTNSGFSKSVSKPSN